MNSWTVKYGEIEELAPAWRGDNDFDVIDNESVVGPFVAGLARNKTPQALLTHGKECIVVDYESPFFLILYYSPARSAFVQQIVIRSPVASADRVYSRDGVDMIAFRDCLIPAEQAKHVLRSILTGSELPAGTYFRQFTPQPA